MSEGYPDQGDRPWELPDGELAMRFFTDPSVGPFVMDRLLIRLGVYEEDQRRTILDTQLQRSDGSAVLTDQGTAATCRDYLSGPAQQHGAADFIAALIGGGPETPGYYDGLEMARQSLQHYTGTEIVPQAG
jgi:hypothetical protein